MCTIHVLHILLSSLCCSAAPASDVSVIDEGCFLQVALQVDASKASIDQGTSLVGADVVANPSDVSQEGEIPSKTLSYRQAEAPFLVRSWPAHVKGSSNFTSLLQSEASQGVSVYKRYGLPLPTQKITSPRQQQDYTVCLSTVPWRVGSIERTIDSLLNQKPLAPSKIILTVPNKIRGQMLNEDDLQWVKTKHEYNNRLMVHRIDNDLGPATKLMGCLAVIPESEDSCIIVTDDDMLRPSHWAQLMLHQHRCTADNGRVAGGYNDGPPGDEAFGHMVHGYRGWAVHRSLLSFEKLRAFWEKYRDSCFFVDDEMFTGYLHSQCLAIDILYSNDANHRVPEAAELISDSSMHNEVKFMGLSSSGNTGGPRMARACVDAVEREQKTKC